MDCKEIAISSMKEYFGEDNKRIKHALSVLKYSEYILEGEMISQEYVKRVVLLTAIFHDIGIPEAEKKYKSSAAIYQELEGPEVARSLLKGISTRADITERVCYIVGHHHTLNAIDDIAFQIIWEADFIVNVLEDWIKVDKEKKDEIIKRNFRTNSGIKVINEILK